MHEARPPKGKTYFLKTLSMNVMEGVYPITVRDYYTGDEEGAGYCYSDSRYDNEREDSDLPLFVIITNSNH